MWLKCPSKLPSWGHSMGSEAVDPAGGAVDFHTSLLIPEMPCSTDSCCSETLWTGYSSFPVCAARMGQNANTVWLVWRSTIANKEGFVIMKKWQMVMDMLASQTSTSDYLHQYTVPYLKHHNYVLLHSMKLVNSFMQKSWASPCLGVPSWVWVLAAEPITHL